MIVRKWAEPGSNRRHQDFQSCALPAELSARERSISADGIAVVKPFRITSGVVDGRLERHRGRASGTVNPMKMSLTSLPIHSAFRPGSRPAPFVPQRSPCPTLARGPPGRMEALIRRGNRGAGRGEVSLRPGCRSDRREGEDGKAGWCDEAQPAASLKRPGGPVFADGPTRTLSGYPRQWAGGNLGLMRCPRHSVRPVGSPPRRHRGMGPGRHRSGRRRVWR
jgi:hypothetical protein